MRWALAGEVGAQTRIPLAALITHRLPLGEAVRGIELMKSKQGLEIMYTPNWA